MPEMRPRVLLADDHPMVLDGLRKLLEPDFEVEATRRLQTTVPGARVLILSVYADPSWVREGFEAVACGYLTKISASEEIGTAVREVLKGLFYISPVVTRGVVDGAKGPARRPRTALPRTVGSPAPAAVNELLTPRELDTVLLVGQGLSNKEIARQLGVSVATVRTHLNKVYAKLGSASRVELALLAAQPGGALT
jgi:DNA-binding NarL/FixJ family response regulator